MIKLDHVALAVKDWRVSRDWYVKHFALKVEFEVPDGGREKLGVAALQDDSGLTLFLEQSGGITPACGCIHYFQVADVDSKYRELSASGAKFIHPPRKSFWGYGAELADFDGHVLRLWDEKSMRENETSN